MCRSRVNPRSVPPHPFETLAVLAPQDELGGHSATPDHCPR